MPKVRQTKEWTESDARAEINDADPRDFVLETSPPDYVEKISQLLGSSSVGQTGQDGAAADPADTDSDSADSLFITQKPVPEAVRSGRRQRHGVRSGPMSPSFQEESEDDSSPLASPQESRSKKNKKTVKLPKYSFPFLKDKTLKLTSTVLPGPQNIRLHYSAMGGFFECMRKLQESCQTGEDLESNLPTVDMNGECIIPISEGEEETLEEADMKVVAKKRFVVPSKVKHSQPWYSEKSDGEVKKQRTSCVNAVDKIPTKRPSLRTALSSDLESSDDEESSYRILGEGGTSDKQQTGVRSIPAPIETPKTNRSLNRENKDSSEQKEEERKLCDDSSSPLCEQSPKERTQEGREASITEPQGEVLNKEGLSQAGRQDSKSNGQRFFQSGANSITICSESKVKKKNNDKEDNESAEEDDNQSQEEPEVQHATLSMNEEITEVEEAPHLPQTINEPELHGKHVMEDSDISDSQQKKKKNKHNTSPAEDVGQELHEHFESDVRIREESVLLDREDNESAKEEMSQSQEEVEVQRAAAYVNEGIADVGKTPYLSQVTSELDLNGRTGMEEGDISDSRHKKKTKKKRQNESPAEDDRQEVLEHFESDVRFGEDSAHLVSSNRGKKKKKKKNNKEDNQSVEEEKSQSQEELEVQRAAAYVNEGIAEMEETPHLSQVTSELDLNGRTGMEEGDISDSRHKKKTKKKRQNESPAEDDRQEVLEHFESDVRFGEDSAHLVSSNRGKKKKKKKKNNKEDNQSVEEEKSQSREELEVQHAAAYVNEGIAEMEETPHLSQVTSELDLNGRTGMEESDISDSRHKKKTKKKKHNTSPAEDDRQEVLEDFESDVRLGVDSAHLVSFNRGKKKKKNNKEDNQSVEEEKSQSQEELEVQHAAAYVNEGITEEEETPHLTQSIEPEFSEKHMMEESDVPNLQQKKKKKKKKRKNEKMEKEKKKTESNDDEEDAEQLKCITAPESLHNDVEMLAEKIAAAESDVSGSESVAAGKPGISAGGPGESAEITGGLEESNERVRKKKKKRRKMTAAQESVEKEQELDFEEPKQVCEEAPSDTGVRKKKRRKRNEAGSESAADAGCSDEAAVVKKKWKKMEEAPAAGSEEKDRSHFEPPSSHSVVKNKQKNLKRHLHNLSEDFLTDW